MMTVSVKDKEMPYENMNQMDWTRRGLKIVSGTDVMYIAMSKKHRQLIASRLREIIPGRSWAGTAAPVST